MDADPKTMIQEPTSSAFHAASCYASSCGRVTLYLGDALEVLPRLPEVQAVVSDPPYPNAAGHFTDAVEAAREFIARYACGHWMIFWDELESPPCGLPLVAKHIWHRSNTNRPDNYEPIYEYHADGKKRASRVLPYPVIYPGLTGCVEATGHPTQKNVKLMMRLLAMDGLPQRAGAALGGGDRRAAGPDRAAQCGWAAQRLARLGLGTLQAAALPVRHARLEPFPPRLLVFCLLSPSLKSHDEFPHRAGAA